MASFFIPLTGLSSDSTALNTIANDLANMNTTAFKSQAVNFSDLFYQQIGSTGSGDITCSHLGHSVFATLIATGDPMVMPWRTPPRMSTSSCSKLIRAPRP